MISVVVLIKPMNSRVVGKQEAENLGR